MKIIYQGFVYETNESTKYVYLFNEMANQIVNKILGIKNEYEAITKYNDNAIDAFEPNEDGDYKLNPSLLKDSNTKRIKKFSKDTDEKSGTYNIPNKINPQISSEGDERTLYIGLSEIVSLKVEDPVIKTIINNTQLVLATGINKIGKGWCLLTRARSGENKGKEVDKHNCIAHQVMYSNDKHALLIVPFYQIHPYSIQTVNYTEVMLDNLKNGIAHELSHIYDNISGLDMSEIVSDRKIYDSSEKYFSKKTELNSYTLNMFNKIEDKIKELLKDPKSNRHELTSLMSSEDDFINLVMNSESMGYKDSIHSMIYVANKVNPKAKEYIINKLKEFYKDLKSRYNNVLPS